MTRKQPPSLSMCQAFTGKAWWLNSDYKGVTVDSTTSPLHGREQAALVHYVTDTSFSSGERVHASCAL